MVNVSWPTIGATVMSLIAASIFCGVTFTAASMVIDMFDMAFDVHMDWAPRLRTFFVVLSIVTIVMEIISLVANCSFHIDQRRSRKGDNWHRMLPVNHRVCSGTVCIKLVCTAYGR